MMFPPETLKWREHGTRRDQPRAETNETKQTTNKSTLWTTSSGSPTNFVCFSPTGLYPNFISALCYYKCYPLVPWASLLLYIFFFYQTFSIRFKNSCNGLPRSPSSFRMRKAALHVYKHSKCENNETLTPL